MSDSGRAEPGMPEHHRAEPKRSDPGRADRLRRAFGISLIALSVLLCLLPVVFTPPAERDSFTTAGGVAPQLADLSPERNGDVRVNAAGEEELIALPGIGPAYAAAILREREANGFFYFPEDLQAVSGIGPRTLEKLRPFLDLSLPE